MQTRVFEFRAFPEAGGEKVSYRECVSKAAARAKAGRIAKQVNGPVDVAYENSSEWPERYITTAMPSEHHAVGYRFERIDA